MEGDRSKGKGTKIEPPVAVRKGKWQKLKARGRAVRQPKAARAVLLREQEL